MCIRDRKYTNSVPYQYGFKNPNSWINSCEKLLDSLPLDIKKNIFNLAISGTSGTLTAFDLKGNPLGKSIPCYQASTGNKNLIDSKAFGTDHLQNINGSLSKALKLIDKFGENIILRHQSDLILSLIHI